MPRRKRLRDWQDSLALLNGTHVSKATCSSDSDSDSDVPSIRPSLSQSRRHSAIDESSDSDSGDDILLGKKSNRKDVKNKASRRAKGGSGDVTSIGGQDRNASKYGTSRSLSKYKKGKLCNKEISELDMLLSDDSDSDSCDLLQSKIRSTYNSGHNSTSNASNRDGNESDNTVDTQELLNSIKNRKDETPIKIVKKPRFGSTATQSEKIVNSSDGNVYQKREDNCDTASVDSASLLSQPMLARRKLSSDSGRQNDVQDVYNHDGDSVHYEQTDCVEENNRLGSIATTNYTVQDDLRKESVNLQISVPPSIDPFVLPDQGDSSSDEDEEVDTNNQCVKSRQTLNTSSSAPYLAEESATPATTDYCNTWRNEDTNEYRNAELETAALFSDSPLPQTPARKQFADASLEETASFAGANTAVVRQGLRSPKKTLRPSRIGLVRSPPAVATAGTFNSYGVEDIGSFSDDDNKNNNNKLHSSLYKEIVSTPRSGDKNVDSDFYSANDTGQDRFNDDTGIARPVDSFDSAFLPIIKSPARVPFWERGAVQTASPQRSVYRNDIQYAAPWNDHNNHEYNDFQSHDESHDMYTHNTLDQSRHESSYHCDNYYAGRNDDNLHAHAELDYLTGFDAEASNYAHAEAIQTNSTFASAHNSGLNNENIPSAHLNLVAANRPRHIRNARTSNLRNVQGVVLKKRTNNASVSHASVQSSDTNKLKTGTARSKAKAIPKGQVTLKAFFSPKKSQAEDTTNRTVVDMSDEVSEDEVQLVAWSGNNHSNTRRVTSSPQPTRYIPVPSPPPLQHHHYNEPEQAVYRNSLTDTLNGHAALYVTSKVRNDLSGGSGVGIGGYQVHSGPSSSLSRPRRQQPQRYYGEQQVDEYDDNGFDDYAEQEPSRPAKRKRKSGTTKTPASKKTRSSKGWNSWKYKKFGRKGGGRQSRGGGGGSSSHYAGDSNSFGNYSSSNNNDGNRSASRPSGGWNGRESRKDPNLSHVGGAEISF